MKRTDRAVNPLSLGRKMRPTQAHRPGVWELMLGTVAAQNSAGEVRSFDYDWDGAVAWAGGTDLRVWRNDRRYAGWQLPRLRQKVLWVKD